MMVSNKAFKVKVNELITAMGGTPEAIVPTCEDDVALNAEVFATGINKIKQNIGGGGSGASAFQVEFTVSTDETTHETVVSADKTIREINTAFEAGSVVIGIYNDSGSGLIYIFTLTGCAVGDAGGAVNFVTFIHLDDGPIAEMSFAGVLEIDGSTETETWSSQSASISGS